MGRKTWNTHTILCTHDQEVIWIRKQLKNLRYLDSRYAREHIDEIPIGSGLEYIGGSDELDEENCEFEKEGGAG